MQVKKASLSYFIVVLLFILLVVFLLFNSGQGQVTAAFASCVAEKSLVYEQEGCSACEVQKGIFGKEYDKLETIDCAYERQECNTAGITATPTWIINGQKYIGVQQPSRLSELTGCEL